MKNIILSCAALALISTSAVAADLSSGSTDYSAPAPASGNIMASRFGIAFDTYYVDQADNDDGTFADGWKYGGNIELALASESATGWGGQLDILGSAFADNDLGNDRDWTRGYLTGAVHLYSRMPSGVYGAFAGGGFTEDTGDSDESQTYWFLGIEGQRQMDNTILFGQVGYLDGDDEYEEVLNQGGFARIGARRFTQSNTAYMAALSGAFGKQDNNDEDDPSALIGNIELEAEHGYGSGETSLFASYEGTFVSFDGGDHNTNFHSFMLGLRWYPGATNLMSAYAGPGSLDLPSFGRWASFTANEVE